MADISKIKLPNGQQYDIKDTTARTMWSSKSAVQDSTQESLVTRGEKYQWDKKVDSETPLLVLNSQVAVDATLTLIISNLGWTNDVIVS